MKFKTFIYSLCFGLLILIVLVFKSCGGSSEERVVEKVEKKHFADVVPQTSESRPVAPAYGSSPQSQKQEVQNYQDEADVVRPATASIRKKIERWLTDYPDRNGKGKLADFLPAESFRATAVRFPENDAVKWSNNPRQWSQVKIDLDRDGVDDEKWLLKNGHTYKRETLDRNGRVVTTEYF